MFEPYLSVDINFCLFNTLALSDHQNPAEENLFLDQAVHLESPAASLQRVPQVVLQTPAAALRIQVVDLQTVRLSQLPQNLVAVLLQEIHPAVVVGSQMVRLRVALRLVVVDRPYPRLQLDHRDQLVVLVPLVLRFPFLLVARTVRRQEQTSLISRLDLRGVVLRHCKTRYSFLSVSRVPTCVFSLLLQLFELLRSRVRRARKVCFDRA